MFNNSLVGRSFTPGANPYYTIYIAERIEPAIYHCYVYIFDRFMEYAI